MSSDPTEVSVYRSLLVNDYISLIGCVIVGYDYILMFPREVNYIWRRRWTWVSAIYMLVRYPGICWADWFYLCTWSVGSNVLFLVSCWTFPVFICAADLLMLLRVYTLWNRSRIILYILLFFYMAQLVVSVVLPAVYNSSPVKFIPTTVPVLNFTVCSGSFVPSVPVLLGVYNAIPRFLISAVLLILAILQTLKQSIDMYNATKQWQPNRYVKLFVRDGVFYFFINTIYNVVIVVTSTPAANTPPIAANVLIMLCSSLLASTMPRFIISVRELYESDARERWQAIDTGFGVMSQGEKGQTSTIAFADAGQEESRTLYENGSTPGDIQLETVGAGSPHV